MSWPTHEVANQAPDLENFNLYNTDVALADGVRRYGAGWHEGELQRFGAELGRPETLRLGTLANAHPPELHTHDRVGRRIDRVEFHPAWHELLAMLRREGLQALPWAEPRPGAQVARIVLAGIQFVA